MNQAIIGDKMDIVIDTYSSTIKVMKLVNAHLENSAEESDSEKVRSEILRILHSQNLNEAQTTDLYCSNIKVFSGLNINFEDLKSDSIRQTVEIANVSINDIIEIIDNEFSVGNITYKNLLKVMLFRTRLKQPGQFQIDDMIVGSNINILFQNIYNKLKLLAADDLTEILVVLELFEVDANKANTTIDNFETKKREVVVDLLSFSKVQSRITATLQRFNSTKSESDEIIEKHFSGATEKLDLNKIAVILMGIANDFIQKKIQGKQLEDSVVAIKSRTSNILTQAHFDGFMEFVNSGIEKLRVVKEA